MARDLTSFRARWHAALAPAAFALSPLLKAALVFQNLLDGIGEGLHSVWLAEPGEVLLNGQLRPLDRRVAAGDDDLLGREQALDLFDDLQPVQRLPHHHVHDDEVEGALSRSRRAAEELICAETALHHLDL